MDSQDILRRPHAATPPSRHDVAYLGRVRKVVDWRGRDAVSFRYDRASGKPVRVTDRLGNHRILEYDGAGNCVKLSRRAGWTVSTEPVRSFSYDRAGRLASVSELDADGAAVRTVAVSRYALGRVVGEEHADGSAVSYAYDAAGRLVREGGRAYRYGYLDKVLSVTEGKRKLTYTYHVDGQLARADYGDGRAEDFAWDGLALVRRGGESFICEPHVGGGNPIASSEGTAYFNDMLGTTVCVREGRASSRPKPRGKCTAAALTAFGEPLPGAGGGAFFTGKPQVEGLGYAFLYRNYRPDLAKWQTADPFGYPDGWNQLAYCNNWVTGCVDFMGGEVKVVDEYDSEPWNEVLDLGTHVHKGYRCHRWQIDIFVYHYVIGQNFTKKRRWESIDGLEKILNGIGYGLDISAAGISLTGAGTIPATGILVGGILFHTAADLLNNMNSWEDVPDGEPFELSRMKKKVDKLEVHKFITE